MLNRIKIFIIKNKLFSFVFFSLMSVMVLLLTIWDLRDDVMIFVNKDNNFTVFLDTLKGLFQLIGIELDNYSLFVILTFTLMILVLILSYYVDFRLFLLVLVLSFFYILLPIFSIILNEVFLISVLPKYYYINILDLFDIRERLTKDDMRAIYLQIMMEKQNLKAVIDFDRDIYPKVKHLVDVSSVQTAVNQEVAALEAQAQEKLDKSNNENKNKIDYEWLRGYLIVGAIGLLAAFFSVYFFGDNHGMVGRVVVADEAPDAFVEREAGHDAGAPNPDDVPPPPPAPNPLAPPPWARNNFFFDVFWPLAPLFSGIARAWSEITEEYNKKAKSDTKKNADDENNNTT